ncbi:MAG: S1 RNA-binding domain-containing protein [Fimbriimonadales bacterium]|nr:S1 RNA-binding domain-containing protein [Fimbriimonadales bacterium]
MNDDKIPPIEEPEQAPAGASQSEAPAQQADLPTQPEPAESGETILQETPEEGKALFEEEMRKLEQQDPTEGARRLSKGDTVEARVVQVEADRVFVDLGTKLEGVVPLEELARENPEEAIKKVEVGDTIKVVVMKPENASEGAVVSKKMADFELVWDKIERDFAENKTFKAQVVDRVKGGLVVDIGVRGFVPGSHVGNGKIRNLERFLGQSLDFKIIEIDRDRRKVVLSNRLAEEELRSEARKRIFEQVKPGAVLKGVVRRLTDYGAFVDLGGVDGLLHISELGWVRINRPHDVLREGQEIEVQVLRLDESTNKISLSRRAVLPDPWKLIKENYHVGKRMTVTIERNVPNGSFVKLPEGAEAFIPISELSARRIKKPEDVVRVGDSVEVLVIDLRPEERRMVLSVRHAAGEGTIQRGASEGPSFDDDERKRGKRRASGRRGGGRHADDDDLEEAIGGGRRALGTGGSGATIAERLRGMKVSLRPVADDDEEEAEPEAAGNENPEEGADEA